jgi:hypothetical protein
MILVVALMLRVYKGTPWFKGAWFSGYFERGGGGSSDLFLRATTAIYTASIAD